jgi:hypothetical protein
MEPPYYTYHTHYTYHNTYRIYRIYRIIYEACYRAGYKAYL